jgi:hypothetical protein
VVKSFDVSTDDTKSFYLSVLKGKVFIADFMDPLKRAGKLRVGIT